MKRREMWARFDAVQPKYVSSAPANPEVCLCGGVIRLDEGVDTCIQCGVMTDTVDMSPEWRYYGDDAFATNPTRCGMPINPLLKESSLGCKVLCGRSSTYEMRKIQRYTEWHSMPYKEKSQYDEFQHISNMASIAGLPKMIIDEACRYHKQISEKQTFRGHNRDGIIAASIYIACRVEQYPRTAKEIARIFHLDTTSATKGCKNAMTILNENDLGANLQATTNPHSFIQRYCSKLEMQPEMTRIAEFISLQVEKNTLIPENTPHSVAAGILYFISVEFGLSISMTQIKIVSDISDVTIMKCFKKIQAIKHDLLPAQVYANYKSAA
jgi:transcription initiation factor TFIIB